MPTKIITKHSTTASSVPTTSDLDVGEIALNTEDRRLYTKDVGGNIVEVANNPSGLEIGGVPVTASVAELNILDGVTATTAEINILDGLTATTAELNTLDGITASTAELNLLDGVTATTTELNYVDGVTANIQSQINALTYGSYTPEKFTGDGSTTNFVLSMTVAHENAMQVYIDGVYQEKTGWDIAGSTLSFSEAPPLNASIEVLVFQMVSLANNGSVAVNKFTGNGSTTEYTLTTTANSRNAVDVFINGIYQAKDNYSVSATTLTFLTAPLDGDLIEAVIKETLPIGTTSADLVNYTPAGTGAVATTVQAKLRETVSVKDFGAVGDGVTDDTAAIQAALESAAACILFDGVFAMSTKISCTLSSSKKLIGGGTIKWVGSSLANQMLDITANGNSFVSDLTYDGNNLAHGGIDVRNSTAQTGVLPSCRFSGGGVKNCYMSTASGANLGITVKGSWERVDIENLEVTNIGRAAGTGVSGSSGTNGVFVSHLSSIYYPKMVIHRNNIYSGMYSGETGVNDVDTDYFACFMPDPTNFPNDDASENEYPRVHVESYGNQYFNPIGRAVKMQCDPFIHHETINRFGGRTRDVASTDINCQWGVGTVEDCTWYLSSDAGQSPITTELIPISFYQGSDYGENRTGCTVRRIVIHNTIDALLKDSIQVVVDITVASAMATKDIGNVTVEDVLVRGGSVDHFISHKTSTGSGTITLNNIVVPAVNNNFFAGANTGTGLDIVATNCRNLGSDVSFMDNFGGGVRNFFGVLSGFNNTGFLINSRHGGGLSSPSPSINGVLSSRSSGVNGELRVESQTIADDATYTFNPQGVSVGQYVFIVSSTFAGVSDVFAATGVSGAIGAITTKYSAYFALGTGSNPDTDTLINMWVDANGALNIKNRLGSSRTFTVMFMG